MTWFVCRLAVSSLIFVAIHSSNPDCVCPSEDQCKQINNWAAKEKQVVVTTDLSSPYKDWLWDTLTTVLVLNKSVENQNDVMCFAHSQGKQYGFFEDVPATFNKTLQQDFVIQSLKDVKRLFADIVALNFIKFVGNCGYSGQHVESIIDSVTYIIKTIKAEEPKLTILCVLPWKPPCYDSDCTITPRLADMCNGLIINLDSFDIYCEESCTAKAIVPYTKLMLSIEEYISMGFNVSQVLISIPWHGYKYTCDKSDEIHGLEKNHICHLKSVTDGNKKICQYESARSKVNLGNLIKEHPELAHQDKTYSTADQAAWYTVKNTDNTSSLIWFEDIQSLEKKYDIVNMFSLKGVVVYTADDLSSTHVKTQGQHDFKEFMWSWLVHDVFSEGTQTGTPAEQSKPNYSGMAVGVGIGMFLMGTLAGVIIACFVFKYSQKPSYKRFGLDGQTDDL